MTYKSTFPLSTPNDADIFICDTINDVSDSGLLRCKKIQIKPTIKQRAIITKWYKWYRYGYNAAVNIINGYKFRKEKLKLSFITIRRQIKDSMPNKAKNAMMRSKIPVHTFDNAIKDAIKATKTAITLLRSGYITHFRLRCKKATASKETLVVESNAFSKQHSTFAMKALGTHIRTIGGSLKGIKRDSRLQYDKVTGRMILYVPIDAPKYECEGRQEYCALDPGIRTFQTLYSPECTYEFGTEEPLRIRKLISKVERLKEHEGTRWYKKYSRRLYDKMRNIRDDMHWKTALNLARGFDIILLGSMSTKSIVKCQGNLHKSVKTVAYMLSHYLFKERLIAKAGQYGSEVVIVDEAWTSKTCGGCSRVNHNLGAKKHFNCEYCNFSYGRDYNGARNIALNYFGLFNPIH